MKIFLSQMPQLKTAPLEQLRELWVTTVNQIYSLSFDPEWKSYLMDIMGNTLNEIVKYAEEKLSEFEKRRLQEVPSEEDYSTGLILEQKELALLGTPTPEDMQPIQPGKEMPSSINWIWKMPQIHVRNQAGRGTCVAFTVTAVNEFLHYQTGRRDYLSPQFVYYECKQRNGNESPGTSITGAMQVLQLLGEPKEITCAYNPFKTNSEGQERPTQQAYDEAKFYKITKHERLNSVNDIKSALLQNKLVAIGIPTYKSWTTESYSRMTGRITMPRKKEEPSGGHAVCIVGYQDLVEGSDAPPGGGFFIIRNSWGEDWGYASDYAPGYGIVPYSYIAKYGEQIYSASL